MTKSPKRLVLFAASLLLGFLGLGAGMYGLAKVASAEPKQRNDVVIQSKAGEIVAFDPPDQAMRTLGFKTAAGGVLCLVLSGVGILFSLRSQPHGFHH